MGLDKLLPTTHTGMTDRLEAPTNMASRKRSRCGPGTRHPKPGDHNLPRGTKKTRDVQRDYPATQFVAKLRRLADCIEQGKRFRIQIAGERISIPPNATINLEHERGARKEEIEFQLTWRLDR